MAVYFTKEALIGECNESLLNFAPKKASIGI